jgi:hypothetical protein
MNELEKKFDQIILLCSGANYIDQFLIFSSSPS